MLYSKVKSYAKLNLALNIVGKSNSLHKIESIISFVDLHDLISVKEIKSKNIPIVVKLHNFRFNCTKSFVSKKHVEKGVTCNACGYISKNRIFNKYFVDSYLKSFLVNYYGKKYFKIFINEF